MFFNRFRKKAAAPAAPAPPISTVASPCDGVCSMDWANNICKSCYRTPTEIGNWDRMDDAAREAVIAASKERQ